MLSPEVLAHRSLGRLLSTSGRAGRAALDGAIATKPAARHGAITLRALEHVIQPEDAPRVLGTSAYLRRAAQAGLLAKGPPWLDAAVHSLVTSLVASDLDTAVEWRKGPCLRFIDLPFEEQTAIVSERLAQSPIAPLYRLLQTTCAAATLNAAA